jgi:hypothetical protein
MRKSMIIAAAMSLLVLPAASAFASEGTFQPAAVASPATGKATNQGSVASFAYSQAEGGQVEATPVLRRSVGRGAVSAGAFSVNTGLNG